MKKLFVFILLLFVLVPFTAGAASVNLSWIPPVVNCDSSTLNDLFGYVILWGGTLGGPYPNQYNVDDPLAVSAVVDVGVVENVTLYFIIVSVDTSGNRSDDMGGCGFSSEVSVPFIRTYPAPPTGVVGVAAP